MNPEDYNPKKYSRVSIEETASPEDLLIEALVIATRFLATGGDLDLRYEMEECLLRAEAMGGEDTRKRVKRIRLLTYSSSMIE